MRAYPTLLITLVVMAYGCRSHAPDPLQPKRIVDLSPPVSEVSACQWLGRRACESIGIPARLPFTPVKPGNPQFSFGFMMFTVVSHSGAHLDAPGRLIRDGVAADQVPLERLYGPVQLWDVRWHDRTTPLQINDLTQQPEIRPGHILLLLSGYTPPATGDWPTYTWLSPQAASWLAAQPIRALATDMPSIGSLQQSWKLLEQEQQPEEVWAERLPFFSAGIPVIEGLTNLEQLLHEETATFVGFPLAIADRSGAPMRAAALVY
ncbi:MAG TPA: cyclase family protein [Candidatus Kryptonia bacterium]|nr:cyclase family protein [Candidatus Kryptonia bacterium]